MTGRRVLIVDDNRLLRLLVRTSIQSLGCELDEATDGEEALAAIVACQPDVVILDVVMPRLDGFEVLARLKEEKLASCRVIMLTTAAAAADHLRASEHGADAYLDKPFDHAELRRIVSELLEQS